MNQKAMGIGVLAAFFALLSLVMFTGAAQLIPCYYVNGIFAACEENLNMSGNGFIEVSSTNDPATDTVNYNIAPNVSKAVQDILRFNHWDDIELTSGWAASTTGSGSVSQLPRSLGVNTGTTFNSTASARLSAFVGYSIGESRGVIDWTRPITIFVIFTAAGTTNDGISRFTLGKTSADGIGALGRKGIGFQITEISGSPTLTGLAHDGVALNTTDLATLSAFRTTKIAIESDGLGNVEFFVNDVLEGSVDGPNTLGTNGESTLQIESDNGVDNDNHDIQIMDIKFYTD